MDPEGASEGCEERVTMERDWYLVENKSHIVGAVDMQASCPKRSVKMCVVRPSHSYIAFGHRPELIYNS